jgi:hypothetical protein
MGWSEQRCWTDLGREPVFAADGSVTLILNSNQHNDSLPIGPGFSHRAISMATAPAADGPYKLSSGPIYKPPGYGEEVGDWIGSEDPCIFQQCLPGSESDCGWHILTHQFGPGAPDGALACNGVAYSRELAGPWTWVNTSAYDKRVPTTGDKPIVLTNRERPHVFMEDGVPRFLYNGAAIAEYGGEAGQTFTMVTRTRKRPRQKTTDDAEMITRTRKRQKSDDAAMAKLDALQSQLDLLKAELAGGPSPAPLHGLLDVVAFGADPSGSRDSSASIQDAFDAAALHASQGTKLGRVWQHEVRFPSGDYKISDTIIIRSVSPNVTHGICAGGHAGRPLNDTTWCMISALRVTGVGMATVEQTSPGRDVFAGAAVYRLEFQYMNLVGGRHQLNVGNNNTNEGFIKISDCLFSMSSGAAIHIVGPSCPDPTCPEPLPQVGSYSSQVIVRDCVFHENDQALVVWSDWGSFSDSWISTSPNMWNKSVVENHDKLFVSNILGVPTNPGETNATLMSWFANYAHRVDGGTLHVRNMRFGGEGGGLTAVVNFAPYSCFEQMSELETEMCGRVPHSGGPLPPHMRGAAGSSIIIEGSQIGGGVRALLSAASVLLREVPAQLIIRDNWVQSGTGTDPSYRLVRVADDIDLNGPCESLLLPRFFVRPMWLTPVCVGGRHGAGDSQRPPRPAHVRDLGDELEHPQPRTPRPRRRL